MMTKKVTDDDNFVNLSSSAQALYLHLAMSADDDGFCNQVTLCMFKAHASVQDLEALLEKRYIYQFENGVIVIKHWRMANALRKDRYTPTAFQRELSMLKIKKNGSYTMSDFDDSMPIMEDITDESALKEQEETQRQAAYRESELPYSFDYKIRQAFYGRECPVCGAKMQKNVDECGITTESRMPTIQHNTPISKGGKHELGNISVICRQCNVTIQDSPTDKLNADEVIEEWEKISGCRLVATCLPQYREDKDSIDKDSKEDIKPRTKKPFVPPTLEEVQAYCKERNSSVDPKKFFDYFTADPERQWMDSEGKPVKSWKQKLITWEGRNNNGQSKPVSANATESTADRKAKWGIKYDNE